MTTIAFDGKTIAADTAQFNGSQITMAETQKIYQCGDEYVAFSGDLGAGLQFVKWWQDGHPMDKQPNFKEADLTALVIGGKEFPVLKFDFYLQGFDPGTPCAIGSGGCEAMGAMLAGASAEEAVGIAIRLDPHSRAPVRVVHLEKPAD